jgi:hypothetical protein
MAKKIKIVNEDPSINFRIPEPLKREIHKRAALENKTVSNYLRDHLSEYMDGSLFEKEVSHFQNHDFINSTEFLQLIVWMYTKREDKNCTSDNDQLDGYLATIMNMSMNLPKYLVAESEKVLYDILRVKNEDKKEEDIIFKKKFTFSKKSNIKSGFNYERLEQYLLYELEVERNIIFVK